MNFDPGGQRYNIASYVKILYIMLQQKCVSVYYIE